MATRSLLAKPSSSFGSNLTRECRKLHRSRSGGELRFKSRIGAQWPNQLEPRINQLNLTTYSKFFAASRSPCLQYLTQHEIRKCSRLCGNRINGTNHFTKELRAKNSPSAPPILLNSPQSPH